MSDRQGVRMTSPSPFILTDGTPDDCAFIATSWTQSYWASPINKYVRRGVYVQGMRNRIASILDRSQVLIARPDDDWREGILGYVVYQPGPQGVIHWWLVKKAWRRQGIGRALLEGALAVAGPDPTYSHHPRGSMAEALWRRDVYYDPFTLDQERK